MILTPSELKGIPKLSVYNETTYMGKGPDPIVPQGYAKIYKKYKTKKAQYNYNLARNKVTFKIKNFKKKKKTKLPKILN